MPYYRILIWTKRKKEPFTGIRLIGEPNINAVQKMMASKAYQTYRDQLLDVEVQMLSKLCSAIIEYEKHPPKIYEKP